MSSYFSHFGYNSQAPQLALLFAHGAAPNRTDHPRKFRTGRGSSFRNGGASFSAILDEENLKVDREGRPRTAYSLRHTYICLRLMEGADIYQIAKNCRTSVEMIEKYYAAHIKAHIKANLDAAAINITRPKPKRKQNLPMTRKQPQLPIRETDV
jgi:integrase